MIDTVRLLIPQARNGFDFQLKANRLKTVLEASGEEIRQYGTFYDQDKKKAVYVEYDRYKGLILNYSIPKVTYGHSLKNFDLNDRPKAEEEVYKILNQVIDVDINKMHLSRLDVCRNITSANETGYYIQALKENYINKQRFKAEQIKDETFNITNKSRRVIFYNKVAEEVFKKEITKAEGKLYGNILRFEIQHKKGRDIKTSFNNDRPLTLNEVLTEPFFIACQSLQVKTFDSFFAGKNGQADIFGSNQQLLELLHSKYKNRNLGLRFLAKLHIDNNDIDFSTLQYLLKPHYTRQGLTKVLKEFQELQFLTNTKTVDLIDEVRTQLRMAV
jgi:hypothetical protein